MFKDPEFIPLRRFRQFTFVDFLSYVGGLLGLFAGISALSFFEVFYFFIPRAITDVMRRVAKTSRVIKISPGNFK
jgi:Amiloride-sensitive sodium channel